MHWVAIVLPIFATKHYPRGHKSASKAESLLIGSSYWAASTQSYPAFEPEQREWEELDEDEALNTTNKEPKEDDDDDDDDDDDEAEEKEEAAKQQERK